MRQNTRLTSVVSYPDRGTGGNNKYRGNCSPKLIEDLIRHYKLSQICDYMCGSGTTRDAANHIGIQSIVHDLHSGFDMMHSEIKERPEFVFWHPPYHDIIIYSDNMYSAQMVQQQYGYDPKQSDLSRIPDWNDFVKVMNYCMMKQFTALEKGGRMAVLVGDIKKNRKLYSMLFELAKPGTIENVIIKTQHNCNSDGSQYSGQFIPIVHEYLLLLRKDMPLLYPILTSKQIEVDIRDMPGATWKDVVADAMEQFYHMTELSQIYAAVENYQRVSNQQHWKEKVRQTLQLYPNIFCSPRRGVWGLRKYNHS